MAQKPIIQKFGRSAAIGTSFVPVCQGNIYRVPTVATQLRVKAGNANDTLAGTGAQKVRLIGLDANKLEISEDLDLAGASASAVTSQSFLRLYRAYVLQSGTVGSVTTGSHADDIVIENAAGTEDWLTIDATDFAKGQSEVGFYSVPANYNFWLESININVDTSKSVDIALVKLDGETDVLRAVENYVGVTGHIPDLRPRPILITGGTDIGVLARVSVGTADVSVGFTGVLVNP